MKFLEMKWDKRKLIRVELLFNGKSNTDLLDMF